MSKSMLDSIGWSGKKCKLAILVPTRDLVHSVFSYCLTQLVKTNTEVGIDTYVFFDSSTILLNQREQLAERAKEINSDYCLWLDSDMSFPSTTALRLLNHDVDVVACNYNKRTLPIKTVAYKDITNWDSWLPKEEHNELVNVEGVGMGCFLMRTNLLHKLEKPYFDFTYNKQQGDWLGEDFNFQKKLREIELEIKIDTLLSMEIKHLGLSAF